MFSFAFSSDVALTLTNLKRPNAAQKGPNSLIGEPAHAKPKPHAESHYQAGAPHPDRKQTVYWDEELRGFGVQCSGKTNQKTFIAQRDLPGGRARRVTIGPVSGLALDVARQRAEDVLDDLRRGIDPKKKAPTFTLQAALDAYLDARPNLRPASIADRQIERVLEAWMDHDLKTITPEMVEARHRSIAKENGEVTANVIIAIRRSI